MLQEESKYARVGKLVQDLLYLSPVLIVLSLAAASYAIDQHVGEGPHREVTELDKQIAILGTEVNSLKQSVDLLTRQLAQIEK